MGDVMIVNTVQFRFPMGSPRPSWIEIANFVKQLDTDVALMETTYRTARDRSLFIKFTTQEAMMNSLERNAGPRSFVYTSGTTVEVRMTIAGDDIRYVRVFDLPPELPDDELLSVLGEFGKIERVVREKFPPNLGLDHMFTGVRGVYMDVRKDIPPSVDVVGRKAKMFYDGLKDTCFLCQTVGHRRDSCPQRKTRERKQEQMKQDKSAINSYAAVVSGKQVIPAEQVMPTDEIIEVLDEEFIDQPSETDDTEQNEATMCVTEPASEEETQQQESMEKMRAAAIAIKEAFENETANIRRAKFANSSSSSDSQPRKKSSRRSYH